MGHGYQAALNLKSLEAISEAMWLVFPRSAGFTLCNGLDLHSTVMSIGGPADPLNQACVDSMLASPCRKVEAKHAYSWRVCAGMQGTGWRCIGAQIPQANAPSAAVQHHL